MIDADQLRKHIIAPALRHIGMWSQSAEDLLIGTAAAESRLGTYLVQVKGPALGWWQMEPATHLDLWESWLKYRPLVADPIQELATTARWTGEPVVRVDPLALIETPLYAAAMARLVYRRHPDQLPLPGDWAGMARLWKARYNTPLGKGTPEHFLESCKACGVIE